MRVLGTHKGSPYSSPFDYAQGDKRPPISRKGRLVHI